MHRRNPALAALTIVLLLALAAGCSSDDVPDTTDGVSEPTADVDDQTETDNESAANDTETPTDAAGDPGDTGDPSDDDGPEEAERDDSTSDASDDPDDAESVQDQWTPWADQTTPAGGINGLVVDRGTIVAASVGGDEVLRFGLDGTILERFPADGAGPDDVTIGPEGHVHFTGFIDGTVSRIVDGAIETLGDVGENANPLAFTSAGDLIVGVAVAGDGLHRFPGGEGPPELIAEAVGDVNAFVVTDDDLILGPAGGLLGPGSIVQIDPSTGTVTTLVADLPAILASDLAPDGGYHVLVNATGAIHRYDPDTGTAPEVMTVPGIYDNLAFAPDGTLYLSHLDQSGGKVTAVAPDGSTTLIEVGRPAAS